MTVVDEWWNRLYTIRKHHQGPWWKSIGSGIVHGLLQSVSPFPVPFEQYLG